MLPFGLHLSLFDAHMVGGFSTLKAVVVSWDWPFNTGVHDLEYVHCQLHRKLIWVKFLPGRFQLLKLTREGSPGSQEDALKFKDEFCLRTDWRLCGHSAWLVSSGFQVKAVHVLPRKPFMGQHSVTLRRGMKEASGHIRPVSIYHSNSVFGGRVGGFTVINTRCHGELLIERSV